LVKRRLREIIRALEPGVAPGFDLVIKAKKTALDQTQEALGSEIEGSLKKLGMLRK
jgi:ribonuclease P protein component